MHTGLHLYGPMQLNLVFSWREAQYRLFSIKLGQYTLIWTALAGGIQDHVIGCSNLHRGLDL